MLTAELSPPRGGLSIRSLARNGYCAPPRRSSIASYSRDDRRRPPLAGFDKLLHYRVPEALRSAVAVGSLVRVPVGRALRLGVVGAVGPPADFPVDAEAARRRSSIPFPALTPGPARAGAVDGRLLCGAAGRGHRGHDPGRRAARRGGQGGEAASGVRKALPGGAAALARRAPAQARLYAFLEGQIRPSRRRSSSSVPGASAASRRALVRGGSSARRRGGSSARPTADDLRAWGARGGAAARA